MGAAKEIELGRLGFMEDNPQSEFHMRLDTLRDFLRQALGRYQALRSPINLGDRFVGYRYKKRHPVNGTTLRIDFGQNAEYEMLLMVSEMPDRKKIRSLGYYIREKDILTRMNGKINGCIDGEHSQSDRDGYMKVETLADEVIADLDKRIKRRSSPSHNKKSVGKRSSGWSES